MPFHTVKNFIQKRKGEFTRNEIQYVTEILTDIILY